MVFMKQVGVVQCGGERGVGSDSDHLRRSDGSGAVSWWLWC
jgi:hypothetical protein